MTQRGHGGVRRTAIAEYPAPSIVHRADRRWGRLALPRLLLISRLLQKIRQSGEDDDDKFSLPTSSGLSENVFEGGARVVNCRRKRRVAHPPELRRSGTRSAPSSSRSRLCTAIRIGIRSRRYKPKSVSALPCAIRSRSPSLTGSCCRNACASAIDPYG